jgi:peptidoglycan/LPS O-acetylase OafA/YrhL
MALIGNSATETGATTRRLPCLDGLRALAVAVVMLNHGRQNGRLPTPDWLPAFNGLGASLFFLISGFLVTILLLDEKSRSGCISLGGFYLRRALRILPAFYGFLAVAVFLRYNGWAGFSQKQLLACLTFWANLMGGHPSWILGHLWSLSLQEQFYLLWPFCVGMLQRRAAVLVTALAIAAYPLFRLLRRGFMFAAAGHLALTSTGMDTILWGCLLAFLIRGVRTRVLLQRIAGHRAGLYVCLAVLWWLYSVAPGWDPRLTFFLPLFRNIGLAWFLWWCISNPKQPFGRFLQTRPIVLMGQMSYSIYLWQQPFLGPYDAWICQYPQNLLAIFAASSLSHHFLERPFDRLRRRVAAGTNRAPTSAPTGATGTADIGTRER